MRRGLFLMFGALVAAAVLTASTGAGARMTTTPKFDLGTRAGVVGYLKSLGVSTKGIVIQSGKHNYAGPTCPGAGWTCTTAKHVVQIAFAGNSSTFTCTPSSGGLQDSADSRCEIYQFSAGGTNSAQCTESLNQQTGINESCVIQQSSQTGTNIVSVTQQGISQGSWQQDAKQYTSIEQDNISGQNQATVSQSIQQNTQDANAGAQDQEGCELTLLTQDSSSGTNKASVSQTLSQHEQIIGSHQVVKQTQDTNDECNPGAANDLQPNLNAAVVQNYDGQGSGTAPFNATINQTDTLQQQVPSDATGTQTQGYNGSGLNGHFAQSSSGPATANGTQTETEQQLPVRPAVGLIQTQWGPMWMGSPQGSNPSDTYKIVQNSTQQAGPNTGSGGQGDQEDDLFGNCDSTGNCQLNEGVIQNGKTFSNTCTGSDCHTGLFVSNGTAGGCTGGGDGGGLTTTTVTHLAPMIRESAAASDACAPPPDYPPETNPFIPTP